jgi:hypothetical protein
MIRKQFLSYSLILASIVFLNGLNVKAQSDSSRSRLEPSFEAVLQVVVASNDTAEGVALPGNLRAVTGALKTNYGFTNYRLYNTLVGRIGNNGTLDYKSVSSSVGQLEDSDTPTFFEWTLGSLVSAPDAKGQAAYQAQPFRFGARVPVKVSNFVAGDSGRTVSTVNYEPVGLTVNRLSLAENTPTLIGSLSLPKTTGTLFLVLTIRPVE